MGDNAYYAVVHYLTQIQYALRYYKMVMYK